MNRTLKFWGLAIAALSAWSVAPAVAAKPKAEPKTVAETPACPAVAAAARKPVIRHLDRKIDGADLKRIWFWRKKLPEQCAIEGGELIRAKGSRINIDTITGCFCDSDSLFPEEHAFTATRRKCSLYGLYFF